MSVIVLCHKWLSTACCNVAVPSYDRLRQVAVTQTSDTLYNHYNKILPSAVCRQRLALSSLQFQACSGLSLLWFKLALVQACSTLISPSDTLLLCVCSNTHSTCIVPNHVSTVQCQMLVPYRLACEATPDILAGKHRRASDFVVRIRHVKLLYSS